MKVNQRRGRSLPTRLALGFLSLAALASSCATLGSGTGVPLENWREVTSEHFVIQTGLDEPAALSLANHLEQYWSAAQLGLGVDLPSITPLKVVALPHQGDLQRLGLDDGVAGFVRWAPTALMGLAPNGHWQAEPVGVVQAHELVHYFMFSAFQQIPKWLSEGMADYLATIVFEDSGQVAVVGRANLWRVGNPRKPFTLAQLWSWDQSQKDREGVDAEPRAYASSWLWVHFLENEHPVQLTAFLNGLAAGEPPRTSFEKSFREFSPEQMEEGIEKYRTRTQQYAVFRYRLPPRAAALRVRELEPVEALWAQYSLSVGEDADRALLQQAERQFPGSLESLLIKARLPPHNPLSASVAKELQGRFKDDPRAANELAEHFGEFPEYGDELTRHAVALSPTDPAALGARIRYLRVANRFEEGLSTLKQLRVAAPYPNGGLAEGAALLAAAGRCSDAQVLSAQMRDPKGMNSVQVETMKRMVSQCRPDEPRRKSGASDKF